MMDRIRLVSKGIFQIRPSVQTRQPQRPCFSIHEPVVWGMDPESLFTFMVEEDTDDMLPFITEQMSAKHGIKEFGTVGKEALMKELEQLVYHKVMES